jgi:hypothetical protein
LGLHDVILLQKASPIVQLNKKAELRLQFTRSMGFLLAFRPGARVIPADTLPRAPLFRASA